MKALYGLDEEGAIQRLAAEQEASDLYVKIKSLPLEGLAGAWFDAETQRLHIALSSSDSESVVARLGAVPVAVTWPLRELEALQASIVNEKNSPLPVGIIRTAYVDHRHNRVVIEVESGYVESARALLSAIAGRVEVREAAKRPVISADVRGADGTFNATWEDSDHLPHPCSIGVSVEDGFYWSGHCGNYNNDIVDQFGVALGKVKGRGNPNGGNYKDVGRVQTGAGWSPTAKINGYSDGLLYVSSRWSGTLDSIYGQTVCRYGQTSGGPYCGTIDAILPFEYFDIGKVYHVMRVSGSCSDAGDSGGTWLSATGAQVQGTNVGTSDQNTCPTSATYTYFQPISDHIEAYNDFSTRNLLTTHGAVAPAVTGFTCPDPIQSYQGVYYCGYDYYDSQGVTSSNWTHSGGSPTSGTLISGTCTGGQSVNVSLVLTNPYGTTTRTAHFACPN